MTIILPLWPRIPQKKWSSHHGQQKSLKCSTWKQPSWIGCNLKNDRMISVHFQGKPFNIMVIQVYALTSHAEEDEVEWFCEDLQGLFELTPKKMSFSLQRARMQKQEEIPRVTSKFGLRIQNETGQRLIAFCQENTLVIANTIFQQHKKRFYMWTSPDDQQ